MAISNRLKSVKGGQACSALSRRFLVIPVLTTKVRQPTLRSITSIMAAAVADTMDMDKVECSISRILPVRRPRCQDNNNSRRINLGVEEFAGFLFRRFAIARTPSATRPRRRIRSPADETCALRKTGAQRRGYSVSLDNAFLSDGNDGSRFDERRVGFVGD